MGPASVAPFIPELGNWGKIYLGRTGVPHHQGTSTSLTKTPPRRRRRGGDIPVSIGPANSNSFDHHFAPAVSPATFQVEPTAIAALPCNLYPSIDSI